MVETRDGGQGEEARSGQEGWTGARKVGQSIRDQLNKHLNAHGPALSQNYPQEQGLFRVPCVPSLLLLIVNHSGDLEVWRSLLYLVSVPWMYA